MTSKNTLAPSASGGGLFGAKPPAPAGGGLFGSTAPAPAVGGGLFGSTAPAPAPGELMFTLSGECLCVWIKMLMTSMVFTLLLLVLNSWWWTLWFDCTWYVY